MSITVEWDNAEKTGLRFVYEGQWTWTEFHNNLAQAADMAATVSYPVDQIYDVTSSASLPSGALSQFRSLQSRSPIKARRRVLVGAGSLITALSQVMLKIYPGLGENFLVAATLDEARYLLKDQPPY